MTMSHLKLPYQTFRSLYQSATQAFLVSSYNAPPHWGGALYDDTGEERCMTTLKTPV